MTDYLTCVYLLWAIAWRLYLAALGLFGVVLGYAMLFKQNKRTVKSP